MQFKHKATFTAVAAALGTVGTAGTAHAFLPWVTTPDSEVFISGASAPSNMQRETVINNLCDPGLGAIDVFVDVVKTAPVGTTVLLAHTEQWAVACRAKNNTTLGAAANTNILVRKSDVNGSGNGTTPVANAVPVNFMVLSAGGCATSGTNGAFRLDGGNYTYRTCTTVAAQAPDAGTSDIEPAMFTGELAPPSGDFVKPASNWAEKDLAGLVFGVVVSTGMRNELQTDQVAAGILPASCVAGNETEACMPSLPSSYVASVFSGKVQDWDDMPIYGQSLTGANALPDPAGADASETVNGTAYSYDWSAGDVNICRRWTGSGTHAQHMVHYFDKNCEDGTSSMVGQPGGASLFFPNVVENSSSGNLDDCMTAIANGTSLSSTSVTPNINGSYTGWAIGYQSLEKNVTGSKPYRYVKIDGIAPTLKNAISGDYPQVYYVTMQWRTTGYVNSGLRLDATPNVAGINAVLNAVSNLNTASIENINDGFVYSFGRSGFVKPTAGASTLYTVGTPNTPWARRDAANNPDSCKALQKL